MARSNGFCQRIADIQYRVATYRDQRWVPLLRFEHSKCKRRHDRARRSKAGTGQHEDVVG